MVKEIKSFQTSDGKTFKTRTGAENHNKKIEVAKVVEKLGYSEDEISILLQKTASHNKTISALLRHEPNWQKWPVHLIGQVNEKTLKEPDRNTLYVLEIFNYGGSREEEIAIESGDNFTHPELHCESGGEEYKVVKTDQVDEYTMKVFLDYKLTWEERISLKLENGENLNEYEIESMQSDLETVYEVEGDEGRWERQMITVVDLIGFHYAIEWSRGLTENQENGFYEQPYRAEVTTREVMVKQTYVKKIK